MSTTPRTDAIYGDRAHAERRVGHGAEALCRELEAELNSARDLHGNAITLLNEETLRAEKLRELLEQMINVAENADETGYVADCGFVDLDKLHEKVRAALALTSAGVVSAAIKASEQAKPSALKLD